MFNWRNKNKKQTNAAIENTSPDRYLDLAKSNDNKRKIIFSLIILQLFSLIIIGQLSFGNSIRTYIIEKDNNNYTLLGYANDLSSKTYQTDDKSVAYFINNFVRKSRYLSSDLVLYKKNYEEIMFFMTDSTNNKLEQFLIDSGYREKIKEKKTVDIEILSTLKLTDDTYQVRWIEKTYDEYGKLRGRDLMVGVYTYKFTNPKNKEMIKYNPLNILITDISQSKETDSGKK